MDARSIMKGIGKLEIGWLGQAHMRDMDHAGKNLVFWAIAHEMDEFRSRESKHDVYLGVAQAEKKA